MENREVRAVLHVDENKITIDDGPIAWLEQKMKKLDGDGITLDDAHIFDDDDPEDRDEVWVVTVEDVYEGETSIDIKLFKRENDAREEFRSCIEDTKKNDHLFLDYDKFVSEDDTWRCDDDCVVVGEYDEWFKAYRYGYYSEDHVNIMIDRKVVNE